MKRILSLTIILLLMVALSVQAEIGKRMAVGTFTQDEMSYWEERSFKGNTSYQLIGKAAPMTLQAMCKNTASALYRKISVDLTKTPVLHWTWRVDGAHPGLNDTTKAGDDYAARIYVVYAPNSLLPWRVKAVNYVWANSQPVGASWPNAFTDQAIMVAARSGPPEKLGQWMSEVRNLREDFKKFFGVDITSINGVAVMTDCDNSGLPSSGYYKDIWFSAD